MCGMCCMVCCVVSYGCVVCCMICCVVSYGVCGMLYDMLCCELWCVCVV